MTSLAQIYTDTSKLVDEVKLRTRHGGPRRRLPSATPYERNERYGTNDHFGSHMPLDAGIHWEWRNPLNILPALILFLTVIALVAMVWA